VHCADVILCRSRCRLPVIPAVHVIDHIFDVFNHGSLAPVSPFPSTWPVGGMQVFDNVQPPIFQLGEKGVEAGALVTPDMRAVIQNDVWCPYFINN